MTPLFGYIPGYFDEKLSTLGVEILNLTADYAYYQDSKLLTGIRQMPQTPLVKGLLKSYWMNWCH